MESYMCYNLHRELSDYYDWVKDNIEMIRWVLLDIAFGFDDFHLGLIEERLQYILESDSSDCCESVGSPETAIRYIEIMFGKRLDEREMQNAEKIREVREILYYMTDSELSYLLSCSRDNSEREFFLNIINYVLLEKQKETP